MAKQGRRISPSPGAWPITLCLLAPFAALVAGCGVESESYDTPLESGTPATPTPTPSPTPNPGTIVVSLDGTGDFTSLKEAVVSAQDGDTIVVAPGTYPGSIDYGTKSLTIESLGSPLETILEGSDCDPSYPRCAVVTIAGGQGPESSLRGFTLTGGGGNRCDESGAPSFDSEAPRCGGGLFVYGSSPALGELVIIGNQADYGGGASLGGDLREPSLEGVQFVSNHGSRGGGLYQVGVNLDARHLRVVDNQADILGGGILGVGGSVSMGGGLIVGNEGVLGGGVHLEGTAADLQFVSFGGNSASGAGGGINLGDGASLSLYGVIMGANSAPQGTGVNLGCGSCAAQIDYTHLEGGTAALGGAWSSYLTFGEWQEGDPDFLGEGDYRLKEGSPCSDAIPFTEGVTDPDGSRGDLGAYGSPLAGLWDLDGDGAYYDWKGEGASGGGDQWDCDDLDPEARPGAREICDGKDTNCDGELLEGEEDQDGDGALLCSRDGEALDCDDGDASAFPGGDEGSDGDGGDNDCDGEVDEGTLGRDDDGDGFCEGNQGFGQEDTCNDGSTPGDCDDERPWLAPGLEEQCDGFDNDCDGEVDVQELDGDEDGFPPCAGDENDNNDSIYPGAAEQANGVDDDLDGVVDENTVYSDDDGDGFCESMGPGCEAAGDCDDTDPDVRPGVEERCDGLDTDCSGAPMEDEVDGDGDGYMRCEGDCADGKSVINPGAEDIPNNGIDEDCDGWDKGAVGFNRGDDNDTQGLTLSCDSGAQAAPPPMAWLIFLLSLGRLRSAGRGGEPRPWASQKAGIPLLLLVLLFTPGCADDGQDATTTGTPGAATPSATQTPYPTATPTATTTEPSPTETNAPTPTSTENPGWIVAQDGSGNALTIMDAYNRANYGATIWVKEGVYPEALELGSKNILIQSLGAPERTVIDASACPRGLCVPVVLRGNGRSSIEIEGFTLRGGSGIPCDESGAFLGVTAKGDRCGGGLYLWESNLTLSHVILEGNGAARGGGMFIGGAEGRATIRNVRVIGNEGEEGGGVMISGGSVIGSWWEVGENQSSGLGGGISVVGGGSLSLSSSIIAQNSAPIGAGVSLSDGALFLSYVAFTGGSAQWGGGISLGEGGHMVGVGAIFAGNAANQGAAINLSCSECSVDLSYSLIEGGAEDVGGASGEGIMAGTGMVTGDPRFSPGGWHLDPESPAIDRGPPTELDSDGTRADIGAYGGGGGGAWDLDGDGSAQSQTGLGGDCDDGDGGQAPDMAEVCDGLDNDCDGVMSPDEIDQDGDGSRLCDDIPDCDDDAPVAYPGALEGYEGDGFDNDCDGIVDELTTGRDDDGDGQCEGAEPLGGACSDGSVPGDCDDLDPGRSGLNEEVCDGLDSDCDGSVDPEEYDLDEDGYRPCDGDKDDRNDAIFPGAPEEPQGVPDGLDNDQDGSIDEGTRASDDDGDGHCEDPYQCVGGLPGGDCDDGDPKVNPGEEEACDGLDTDCQGGPGPGELDKDGDGVFACGGDCDDDNSRVYPGAVEVPQDGIDQDCNGVDLGVVGFVQGEGEDPDSVTFSCGTSPRRDIPLGAYLVLFLATLRGVRVRGLGRQHP